MKTKELKKILERDCGIKFGTSFKKCAIGNYVFSNQEFDENFVSFQRLEKINWNTFNIENASPVSDRALVSEFKRKKFYLREGDGKVKEFYLFQRVS